MNRGQEDQAVSRAGGLLGGFSEADNPANRGLVPEPIPDSVTDVKWNTWRNRDDRTC